MAVNKEYCVRSAMAAGLDRAGAEKVVEDLLAERARAEAARARGTVANAEESLAQNWASRMEEEKFQIAAERKKSALNVLTRQRNDARINAVRAEGFSDMDALEAMLVGSNKRFFGARASIDSRRSALRKDFLGGMINELEALDGQASVRKLFEGDPEFSRIVIREVVQPESTGDATARAVADIFSRHMEKARLRENAAGANIGRLDGYLPQSHDAWKMGGKRKDGKSARDAWVDFIQDKLDMERSFPDVADPAELRRILNGVYDNIMLGRGQGPTALERGLASGPGNLADRLGRHRVLRFKDADAFMSYHAEYGRGSVLTGVLSHLDAASRNLALMEVLGPNPEAMLKSIISERARLLEESLRGEGYGPEAVQAVKDLRDAANLSTGKVAAWFRELTGEANWAANTTAARVASTLRASQTLSKLGGAALSATADVFIKAMNMRVHGLSWGEAISESIAQYTRTYKGQDRIVARQLGAFVDDVTNEMRLRWDTSEAAPGALADLQDKLFRWSGLNWITESGKAGFAVWFSRHLGEVAGLGFDKLDAPRRATLEYHGFDARRWELVRRMTEEGPDGRTLLSPQKADTLPDNVLRGWLSRDIDDLRATFKGNDKGFAQAEAALFERARRDLRTDVMSMIADETQYAIIEPDAKTRAFMRQGTRPGTVAGEFWRTMMQFKSFPLAYMQRQMGGRRWVRGDLQKGMRYGWNAGSLRDAVTYDPRGVTGAALSAFAFGYAAMTLKDLARGKKLRDPFKVETVMAALMQSGGAGILGDFFFNKVNRFGGGLGEVALGPVGGEVSRAFSVVSSMLRGEFQQGGEDALRLALDNAPFINLWYTREGLNWLLLYHIRESLSPGTLSRTERKMKEEYGQEYVFSPARGIARGGWGFTGR